jgi:hypothetical protein
VAFAFDSPSPRILCVIGQGNIVGPLTLVVIEAFDDPQATLTVGTSADPSAFLGPGDSDLTTLGQYASGTLHAILASDYLMLFVDPKTSTRGSGILYYQLSVAT